MPHLRREEKVNGRRECTPGAGQAGLDAALLALLSRLSRLLTVALLLRVTLLLLWRVAALRSISLIR